MKFKFFKIASEANPLIDKLEEFFNKIVVEVNDHSLMRILLLDEYCFGSNVIEMIS